MVVLCRYIVVVDSEDYLVVLSAALVVEIRPSTHSVPGIVRTPVCFVIKPYRTACP